MLTLTRRPPRPVAPPVFTMLKAPWRIEMLGGLRLVRGDRATKRFRTRTAGSLLAYLAYHAGRPHPREELADLFWPDEEAEVARHNLRQCLFALRRQLEPPGVTPGAVLVADRSSVELRRESTVTDVAEFESMVKAAARAPQRAGRTQALARAAELYRGDLLPGFYDEWVHPERERLSAAHVRVLVELARLLGEDRDLEPAIELAGKAVARDPLREESHYLLIRLLLAAGRLDTAERRYEALERVLRAELGERPARSLRELRAQPWPRRAAHTAEPAGPGEAPEARAEAPEPARQPRLPLVFTRFFGRQEETARLLDLLHDPGVRLVTITGTGGAGKTRLAIEVARRAAGDAFGGAAWFVSLADLSQPHLIPEAIVATLELPRSPAAGPLEQAATFLGRQRRALLVLDNYEHLLPAGGAAALALLSQVPSLTCLITSRRRLVLDGEHELALPPLPAPSNGDLAPPPERLLEFASVELFADRAQAVRPDFRLTTTNAPHVARLCALLEGIPLAIELAAARTQVLTVGQLASRLSGQLELLASRRVAGTDRHRSLWAAIEWSTNLLDPEVRAFFFDLAVFRGGWTAGAAESVCRPAGGQALDRLEHLRAHSLITAEDAGGDMRFRMLEPLREYAWDQLGPPERAVVQERHATYFLALAEEASPHLKGPDQGAWLDRLDREHENFLHALERCTAGPGQAERGLLLANALYWFWWIRGHLAIARHAFERALACAGARTRTPARTRALTAAANLARHQSDYPAARALGEEALGIARDIGDRLGLALALNSLGLTAREQADLDAAGAWFEEALGIHRELGDRSGIASLLTNLGNLDSDRGDGAGAAARHAEALELRRQLGDVRGIAGALNNLGTARRRLGDLTAAAELFREALAINHRLGNPRWQAFNQINLGLVAIDQGDLAAARSYLEESLRTLCELGDRRSIAESLDGLARLAAAAGAWIRAARAAGAADAIRGSIQCLLRPDEEAEREVVLRAIREALGEAALASARAEGAGLGLDAMVEEALRMD